MSPRPRYSIPAPDEPASILLASPYLDDHALLPQILEHPHWRWQRSQGCREALRLLNSGEVTVVICERDQPDGCWRDLLRCATALPLPPSLVVCSRLADECLWAEVLNLGGYDVLVKPFDREEVLRVAFLAWHSWKRHGDGGAVSKPADAAKGRFIISASAA